MKDGFPIKITDDELNDLAILTSKVRAAGNFLSEFDEDQWPNTGGFHFDLGLKLVDIANGIIKIKTALEMRAMEAEHAEEWGCQEAAQKAAEAPEVKRAWADVLAAFAKHSAAKDAAEKAAGKDLQGGVLLEEKIAKARERNCEKN